MIVLRAFDRHSQAAVLVPGVEALLKGKLSDKISRQNPETGEYLTHTTSCSAQFAI